MVRRTAVLAGSLMVAIAYGPISLAYANTAGQYVRTESGKVRCWVTATGQGTGNNGPTVICEASSLSFDQSQNHGFLQAPMTNYGSHWHAAVVDAAGNFQFEDGGNIGGSKPQNDLVLQYGQTYDVSGWTILPTSDGSRFTNDGTGHGMFVSIENVYPF